jgi:hypothetical protein
VPWGRPSVLWQAFLLAPALSQRVPLSQLRVQQEVQRLVQSRQRASRGLRHRLVPQLLMMSTSP